MKRLTNIMRKQLLLISMLFFCVLTYGEKLPKLYQTSVTSYLEYGEPMLLEELSSNNHRFLALEVHNIHIPNTTGNYYTNFALKFDDRPVYDHSESSYSNPLQTLDLFKCYDKNIPALHVYPFSYEQFSNECATYYNLKPGYTLLKEGYMGHGTIIVLPMLTSVSSGFYKDKELKNSVDAVVEGDKVYFKAEGEGDIVASFNADGTDHFQPKKVGNVYEITAQLCYSLSYEETQYIYIFTKSSNGGTYYSSNYAKLRLTVKPAVQFVNVLERDGVLYLHPDIQYGNKIKIKKLRTDLNVYYSLPDPSNPSEWGGNNNIGTTGTDIAFSGGTLKINIKVSNRTDHIETYTIKTIYSYTVSKTNCTLKISAPPYLPTGVKAYPIVSFSDGKGGGGGGPTSFDILYTNKYKYYYYVVYEYKGKSISNNQIIVDFLPMKLTTTVENIQGCENNSNSAGSITITASGGSGTYTYSSSPAGTQNGNVFKYTTTGNKTVTVTDSYGCKASATNGISVNNQFKATFASTNIQGCENNSNTAGTITITAEKGSGTYTYSSSPAGTQSGNVFKYTTAGNKTVIVTDGYGCKATATKSISVSNPFKATFASTDIQGCENNSNTAGKITVTPSGGSGTYTYSSDDKAYGSSNVFSYTTKGNKSVYVKDSKGCKVSATKEIKLSHPFAATFTSTDIQGCENNNNTAGKITVTPSGGSGTYTYSSNPAGTQSGNVYKYTTTGNKTVTVTDSYGCKASATKTIGVSNPFKATFASTDIKGCEDNTNTAGTITVTPSGGSGSGTYTYSSSPAGTLSGNVFKYTKAGNKTVTVTDKNGCTSSATKKIEITDEFNFTLSPTGGYDIKCNGDSKVITINITGSNGGYQLNNNPISSGAQINKGAGTHFFTISDSKGCSVTKDITLTQPSKVTITKLETVNTDCKGENNGSITITANGGVGSYKYTLDNNSDYSKTQSSNVFSGLAPSSYTIKVKDANNCASESVATVGNNNLFVLPEPEVVNVKCFGKNTGSITLNPQYNKSGFNGKFNYWLNDVKKGTNVFAGLYADQYKVKVQPEGSKCVDSMMVTISEPTELKYTVDVKNCQTTTSTDGQLTVTPSGGIAPYTIKVNGRTYNGTSINNLPSSTYTVTVADANSCVADNNIKYSISKPEKDLSLSVLVTDVKCYGNSTGAITANASGGWGNYAYTISPNKGSIKDNGTSKIFENLPAGTYKITVEDKMHVIQEKTVEIKQPAALSASSKTDNVKCSGMNTGKITVTVTGGTSHYSLKLDGKTYTDNNGIIEIDKLPAGEYQYSVADANGCVTPGMTTKVNEPEAINLIANAGHVYNNYNIKCNGGTDNIVVTATGGSPKYKFSIDGGTPTTTQYSANATCTLTNVSAGLHTVTCIDNNGCTATQNIELSQPDKLIIDNIITSQPLCNGGSNGEMTIVAKGGIQTKNYNFTLNSNNASEKEQHTFTGLAANSYHVVVKDGNNCVAEKTVVLGEPALLTASVSNVKNNLCNGDELGSITFAVNGGTAPYDYALNGKDKVAFDNSMTISGLRAQNKHSIVVSDAHGCVVNAIEQKITEPAKITAKTILNDYNGYNIRCYGDADDARIEISGGAGNYSTTLGDKTQAGSNVVFSNLKFGNYNYVVTDGNECSESFQFEMKQPKELLVANINSTDAKCYNAANGALTANVKGGVRNYTYNIAKSSSVDVDKLTTDAAVYTNNSIAAGEYTFKVTDANNCVISQSFVIGQPAPLTVSVSKLKDVDCKGSETGAVSATANGGTSPYSYSWNKGMTGQSIQNLPAGEYSVMVTDANNCQSEVDENGVKAQTTIDEPASALTMLEPVYANPTCSYNKDGEITINVSGGWGGYEYTLNGVSYGSNKIEGLDEGTYTAKVKDAGGCEVPTNDITLKKPEALSFENKIGTIICKGGATDVTITSASGGTGSNYSYSIDGGNTWQTGTTFANVEQGSYILKMKDGNGCQTTDETDKKITVTEPELLVLKEDVRHNYNGSTHKANGKITVTPQGGVMPYSYQWKDTTVTSQVLDNIGFGLYTIIVTDKLGCVETNTYYINDNNPTPEVVDAICPEGADGSIRFGETVECTRVEWYNARTEERLMQSDTKTITGLSKGIYKAKLFNDSQVTYIYAEVKAPDSLEYVQNQTNIDCHGDDSGKASVSITGGVAPVSVVWKNQNGEEISRNQTIENLITGKYTAYISDAKNCQSSGKTLEFDIIEPADAFVLDENTHNNVKCYGNNDGVVVLRTSGNQGDVTYFQNGAAIPSNEAKSLYAGDYAFYAVDAKNCKTQTMNVVVSQPEPLSSSVKTIMPIKCATETGSVKVEAEGGTTPYSYKVLEQNDFRLSPIFDGLTTDDYKFVVKDVNNCYDTASYLLTEPEQLVITGNQLKDEYCGHSDGSISIEIAGGTGGYDTRWSDYQTGESASDLAAGSYQVSVFDENGCLATETYEIKNIPAPVVSIRNIDSTKCYGSADGVAELNVSLGTGAISYLWATDTTDVPYSGKLKAGLQSVVAVDELGCADTTQFTMPQPDSMKIVIAVQNPLCFNDNSGKLTASVSNYKTGLSYKWDNGVAGSENTGLYAGTYGVSVTNANGCVAKKNATLVYPAKITIKKVAIDDTKCDHPNGSISVSAAGGTGILKFGVNPENMAAANKIEGLQSGNHKLMVIDENQCSIDTTILVGAKVPPELVINTIDDVRCQGEANGKVSVGVNGGMEPFAYSWNNGNRTTSSTQNGFKVGNHTVLVFDAYGCSDTLSFAINEPDNLVIYEGTIVDPTCFGYSDGQIKADVLGGTRPYSYQWSNNQSVAQATGLPAGSHYLNVTDKNGCKAKKYFSLTNPLPVVVDIPDVIDICSNQTADIDAGYEGSFHYWSSANGFESVAQNISVNKKGTYVVTVTTLDGCIGTDSTFVNVSDKEINSNFLLQSDAYVGDTIVMIEISWPLPESIEWSCPDGMTIISDAGDEIEMVADKEGIYDIGLTTYNDICTEQTFKSIVVNPQSQKPKQMLQTAPKIIKSVNVYPTPTTGPFNLEIELNEEHDVSIEIVHMSGKLQTVRHMKGDRNYVLNFSNAELNAGIHTISVSAGSEKVTKKVVIVK